jgi:hypothetical protein
MAKGIQLAGGFGAGGVRDALVDLLAQKMAERDFLEKQRQAGNAETLARETLGQRKTEASMEDAREKSRLRENQRQFGETLGLNVKKLGEETRQFDTGHGENVRQFDTGLEFKKGESTRDQGNKDRSFGLDEMVAGSNIKHQRVMEGLAGQKAAGASGANDPQLGALSEMVLNNPDLLDKMTPTDRTKVLKHIATAKDGAFPNKRAESMRSMLDATDKTVQQLRTMAGRSGAVGAPSLMDPGSLTRVIGRDPMAGSDASNYAAAIDQLKSQLTLPRMEMMRGLGAMSEKEFETLTRSATSLGTNLSEEQFGRELENIASALSAARQRSGSGAPGGGGSGGALRNVGDVVNVGGKRVRITKLFPDGTFDGEDVP